MGFESEIQNYENDAYTHVVFDDYRLCFVNSDDDEDDDNEFWKLYDEIATETPYNVEYNWYEENANIPGLIAVKKNKMRHNPGLWYGQYVRRS